MEMHNRRRDSIAAPLATAELPLSSAVLALEREASLERRDCEIQPHPLSSSSPPPHTGKMPRDYYPPPPPKSSWSHDEDTPTSPQGASAFEKSHSRAMELMRKIRRRRRPQPQPAAEPQQYASRRRPAPPLIIEEAANSPSHPLPRAQNDPSTLFRHPPPALVRQSIASDDQARSAPSPSSPREQVAPEDGLTITIPIPRAALRSRPKHRYISPTKLDHPPLPSPSSPNPSPTELANLAGKPSPSVPQRRDSGVDADTPRLLPPSPLPAAGEPVSTSATSRFARTRERRRRAREYSVSCVEMFPMDGARPSKTLIIPFLSPPHPPSSSIPSFAGSGERPLPPALSNSADFTLTVHQATPLYPGDMFSFIVEIKDPPSTSSPPTFSLSFSAHSFLYPSPSYVAHDASITHHTLFSRTNQIPVPTNRATTPLSLPFSTSIPLSVECETCSAHYDLLPPSLRVEDPDGNLRARVSYELMATWGEKVAVAEVQVAQRREVVQEKLRRGQWVKLEGEKEMQGGWEGWDLTRVEMAYHLPFASQPSTDLLVELKSSLSLLPSHCNDPEPLLSLLPRLNADHSRLALYEVLVGPRGPVLVTRTWSSRDAMHDLQLEVETFTREGEEGAKEERGVELRRRFKLKELPLQSFMPVSACSGWSMEYRFELVLGQLDRPHRSSTTNDCLRFSLPFITTPTPIPGSGEDAARARRSASMLGRAWGWIEKGSRKLWKFARCGIV